MEKVCGYKSKAGSLYSTEEECRYADLKSDHDVLEHNLLRKMAKVSTRPLSNQTRVLDYAYSPENTELCEISSMCNMLATYRKELNELHIKIEPPKVGRISKVFSKLFK